MTADKVQWVIEQATPSRSPRAHPGDERLRQSRLRRRSDGEGEGLVAYPGCPLGATIAPMNDPIDNEILEVLGGLRGIDALAIFGSRACGRSRPDSDLDVAVLTVDINPAARRHLQSDIATALAHLAPEGRVDVVFLDEAPELLRQRIMENGRLLICTAPGLWREWRVRTMREHGDRENVRRLFREAQARRFKEGGIGDRSGHAVESLERTRELHR